MVAGRTAYVRRTAWPCELPRELPKGVPTPSGRPPPGVTRQKVLATGPLVCAGGQTGVPVEQRIEFDDHNSRPTYDRGIAVYSERRINGVVVTT